MRFSSYLPVLAVICSVISTPVEDATRAPIPVPPARNAEAIPIPTLLPRSQLQSRDDAPKDSTFFGIAFKGDEAKKSNYTLNEDSHDDLWCKGVDSQGQQKSIGRVFSYYIIFDAICYFHEKECDPSKGEAEAIVGWEGTAEKDAMNVEHKWDISSYACHWQNKTIGTDLKIGDPKNVPQKGSLL